MDSFGLSHGGDTSDGQDRSHKLSKCNPWRPHSFMILSLEKMVSIVIATLLIVSTMNMTCFSHLKFVPRYLQASNVDEIPNNTPANVICKSLHSVFTNDNDLNGLLLQGLLLPVSIASLLAAIIGRLLHKKRDIDDTIDSNKNSFFHDT